MITAKAKGLGPMNSDIMSKEKPTYLIVNPGLDDVSKPPPPLHHKFEGTLDEVGPYSMQMQSQHCMVGGLLLFRLNLLFPPIDLLIYTIKVKIVQSFKLRSPIDKDHHAEPPQSAQTVFIIDASHPPNFGKIADTIKPVKPENLRSSPLKAVRQDELWKIHHLARLPNDNMIRPSTFEGTITPIAVSHTIQMEMTYRPMTEDERNPPSLDGAAGVAKKGKEKEKEPERRKVVMSKPLELSVALSYRASYQLALLTPPHRHRLVERQANDLVLDDSDAAIEYVAAPKPPDSQPLTPTSPAASLQLPFFSSFGESDATPPVQPPVPTPPPPLDDSERGRTAARTSPTPPSSGGSSRAQSSTGFFRGGQNGDRWFGWRSPSAPGSQANSREGSRAPSRSASRQR
ncbi:hypothetical protein BMF94_2063 [Rhodotorula taiwanensis]|uniref:Uncharacterized protein n=1 Tax=Rhodotorula taiwanensis TaxID=741276 RepID=A0A2S5BDE5_9BASI|nr:hypothetical protein BMF94_2063 [Rhodotorula taiwanensis]